ncbi:MAG: PPC domain-containing DNA-binding protein [Leptolyngbyaceae cyanobacterium]
MTSRVFASTGLIPHCLRLNPGSDLKESLRTDVVAHEVGAGCILTTVGSLQQTCLRLAGQSETTTVTGRFEIMSLVGTLSPEGLHLHMAIADA